MKIFAVSDMHGQLEGLDPKGVDLVLVAGDFAPMHGWSTRDLDYQVCWVNSILLEWISSYPKTQFRFIPGNHDLFAQNGEFLSEVRLPTNAKLLIDQSDEVDGLRIYGTPWVPYINGRWAFEEMGAGRLREKFEKIPVGIDILLTHTPPRIRHKKIDVSIERNTPHLGSLELTDAILAREPRFVFCGHIHTGDHNPLVVTNHDGSETIAWNVSRLNEDYRICYEPFILEL